MTSLVVVALNATLARSAVPVGRPARNAHGSQDSVPTAVFCRGIFAADSVARRSGSRMPVAVPETNGFRMPRLTTGPGFHRMPVAGRGAFAGPSDSLVLRDAAGRVTVCRRPRK